MNTQTEPTIEDLFHFGYAPGNYMGKCHDCGKKEAGRDKRAWRCLSPHAWG